MPKHKIKLNCVICGGGKSPINECLPKGNTNFIGFPLAGRVYNTIKKADVFNRIALVMNPDKRIELRKEDKFVDPTFNKGAFLSAYRGIKSIDDDSSGFVIVAGDLPFLNERILRRFIENIEKNEDIGILIPLIPKEKFENSFPKMKEKYFISLQDGDFCLGNIEYFSFDAIRLNEHMVNKAASAYQQFILLTIRAILFVGLRTVIRLIHVKLPVIKQLKSFERIFPKFSINELENVVSELLNVNVRLIIFPYPETAFDIDQLWQLSYAEELLFN